MHTLILPAPAKINWFLHVLGRRRDGYHLLQTTFQFLDYSDELSFTLRNDGQLQLASDCADVAPENNLILRAAQKLQEKTRCRLGADMSIIKRIPIGGGLGGGSSNAATTLLALNQLWDTQLSTAELVSLGVELGADVPIFIHGHAAWGEGIGEELQSVTLPEPWIVVVTPPCQVSTVEIFTASELTRNTQPITIASFLQDGGRNDLEPVACQRYPLVAEALRWLSAYAPAKMTGSGGCVFAAFAEQSAALAVAAKIPTPFHGWAAKALNVSPLHSWLGR